MRKNSSKLVDSGFEFTYSGAIYDDCLSERSNYTFSPQDRAIESILVELDRINIEHTT